MILTSAQGEQVISQVLEDLGRYARVQLGEHDVRLDYPGRSKYGRPCLSFTVDSTQISLVSVSVWKALVAVSAGSADTEREAWDVVGSSRWDRRGRHILVYFPALVINTMNVIAVTA